MTSYFTWLDHSERDRRRMLDVIDAFREQETRDELGLGTIRDALADLLFPGTSTIQTRVRYFLFVPWIYLPLETRRAGSTAPAYIARRDEVALINALADAGETDGVIGIDARARLKRLPSAVYWQGLGAWGIRLFPGSQDQYFRSLDRIRQLGSQELRNHEGESIEGNARTSWDPRLPPAPTGFPNGVTFALLRGEAEYLRDRILARCPNTLLAWLVDEGKRWKPVSFAWQHPQFASFPDRAKEQLAHARNLSETMHGAALQYNLMLAEAAKSEDWVTNYREQLELWGTQLAERQENLATWSEARFWTIVRAGGAQVGPMAEAFVTRWLALLHKLPWPPKVDGHPEARRLITERERALKKDLARLGNLRALERWRGAAGADQISYRWGKSQRLVLDILAGLQGTASDA